MKRKVTSKIVVVLACLAVMITFIGMSVFNSNAASSVSTNGCFSDTFMIRNIEGSIYALSKKEPVSCRVGENTVITSRINNSYYYDNNLKYLFGNDVANSSNRKPETLTINGETWYGIKVNDGANWVDFYFSYSDNTYDAGRIVFNDSVSAEAYVHYEYNNTRNIVFNMVPAAISASSGIDDSYQLYWTAKTRSGVISSSFNDNSDTPCFISSEVAKIKYESSNYVPFGIAASGSKTFNFRGYEEITSPVYKNGNSQVELPVYYITPFRRQDEVKLCSGVFGLSFVDNGTLGTFNITLENWDDAFVNSTYVKVYHQSDNTLLTTICPTSNNITVSGLIPGDSYKIVASCDEVGSVKTYTDQGAQPYTCTGLAASSITTSGLTLTWAGNAPSYRIYRDNVLIGTTTNTTYNVTGVKANSSATYKVETNGTEANHVSTMVTAKTNNYTLKDLKVSRSSHTYYTLTWTGDAPYYKIIDNNNVVLEKTASKTATIKGLTPGTKHMIYVEALDSQLNSGYTKASTSITTSSAALSASLASSTPDSAKIAWTGDAKTCEVIDVSSGKTVSTGNGVGSFTLTGLKPGTSYTVGVKGNWDLGFSTQSSESSSPGYTRTVKVDFTTPEITLSDIKSSNVSFTKASLSWTGNAPQYKIYKNGSFIKTQASSTFSVSDLEPRHNYLFRVDGCTSDGTVYKSKSISIKTTAMDVHGVSFSDITTSGVTVSWTGNAESGYKIHLENGSDISKDAVVKGEEKYSFVGLNEDEKYDVTVVGLYGDGKYTTLCHNTFRTLAEDTIVSDLMAYDVTENTFTITWSSKATSFTIYVDGQRMDSTAKNTYTLSELQSGQSYKVRVSALNSSGREKNAADITVTTGSGLAKETTTYDGKEVEKVIYEDKIVYKDPISGGTVAVDTPSSTENTTMDGQAVVKVTYGGEVLYIDKATGRIIKTEDVNSSNSEGVSAGTTTYDGKEVEKIVYKDKIVYEDKTTGEVVAAKTPTATEDTTCDGKDVIKATYDDEIIYVDKTTGAIVKTENVAQNTDSPASGTDANKVVKDYTINDITEEFVESLSGITPDVSEKISDSFPVKVEKDVLDGKDVLKCTYKDVVLYIDPASKTVLKTEIISETDTSKTESKDSVTYKTSDGKKVTISNVKKVTYKWTKKDKVSVSWKKSNGATGYKVYIYKTNGKKLKTYTTKKTTVNLSSAKIKKAIKNKGFIVKIKAYKKVSGKNYYGNITKKAIIPQAVVKAKKVSNGTKFTWKKISGAKKYVVYVKKSSGKIVKKTVKKTTYTIKNVKKGTVWVVPVTKQGKATHKWDTKF